MKTDHGSQREDFHSQNDGVDGKTNTHYQKAADAAKDRAARAARRRK